MQMEVKFYRWNIKKRPRKKFLKEFFFCRISSKQIRRRRVRDVTPEPFPFSSSREPALKSVFVKLMIYSEK